MVQEGASNHQGINVRAAWTWVLLQFLLWLIFGKILLGTCQLYPSVAEFLRAHALSSAWIQIVLCNLLFVLMAYWCAGSKSVVGFMEIAGLRRNPTNSSLFLILGAVFLACLSAYAEIHHWTGYNPTTHFFHKYGSASDLMFQAYVCFVGPISEEVAERGFIFPVFRSKYGLTLAILLSCGLNIFYHQPMSLENGFNFCAYFLFAIMMCLIRERTSSTWACIFAHSLNNAIVGMHWSITAFIGVLYLAIVGKSFLKGRSFCL